MCEQKVVRKFAGTRTEKNMHSLSPTDYKIKDSSVVVIYHIWRRTSVKKVNHQRRKYTTNNDAHTEVQIT